MAHWLYRAVRPAALAARFEYKKGRVWIRDCSKLAENMSWQTEAVRRVLGPAFPEIPAPTPVLCFVDGEWPLISPPDSFRGVRLEGARSIEKLVTLTLELSPTKIRQLAQVLATAFPPK